MPVDETQLTRSEVVANASMNRSRGLQGVNSYSKELRFELLPWLLGRVRQRRCRWLDLCCGEGRAMRDAVVALDAADEPAAIECTGVDLVPAAPSPARRDPRIRLVFTAVHEWEPSETFDLITCVHGLHYVGDKLGLVRRAARWLTPTGVLLANLDLHDITSPSGRRLSREVLAGFRAEGVHFNRRTKVVRIEGPRELPPVLRFVGADDTQGPNYTGQPSVRSYYQQVD